MTMTMMLVIEMVVMNKQDLGRKRVIRFSSQFQTRQRGVKEKEERRLTNNIALYERLVKYRLPEKGKSQWYLNA